MKYTIRTGSRPIGKRTHSFKEMLTTFVVVSVVSISFIVILLTMAASGRSILSQAKQLAVKQEESIKNALEQEIDSIYQLGTLMASNGVILQDVGIKSEEMSHYQVFSNEVYINLLNFKKMNQNIAYISLLKYEDETIKYVGSPWSAKKKELYLYFKEDYQKAEESVGSNMKNHVSKNKLEEGGYVLNLYFPIYDTAKVYKEIGVICIGISEETLSEYYQDSIFTEAHLLDSKGTVISSVEKKRIGRTYEYINYLTDSNGLSYQQKEYLVYDRIKPCDWYIVANISINALLEEYKETLIVSAVVVCLFCAVAILICYQMTKRLLFPLEDVKKRMSSVAAGDLSIQMDIEYEAEEFNEMAQSFNKMVKDVDALMKRSREEQIQMKQIELNALQSQIKPHFLYNTLECIHMQAVIDGSDQISMLVKALASYYRLCLSKGKDIVTLEQELAHIENYLIIQNIRYSDIVTCTVVVTESLKNTPIPKMTLQPLIENSIYHGIKIKEGFHGEIRITGEEQGEFVMIKVIDTGIGMTQEEIDTINKNIHIIDEQYGYGVRNVHRRLQILFGEDYGLCYSGNPCGGTIVTLKLPK